MGLINLQQSLLLDIFQLLVEHGEEMGDAILNLLLDLVWLELVHLSEIVSKLLVPCVNFLLGLPRLIRQKDWVY